MPIQIQTPYNNLLIVVDNPLLLLSNTEVRAPHFRSSLVMLEILHGALVRLRGFLATERAQVATAAGLSILFA
jgi:hypothetical protein